MIVIDEAGEKILLRVWEAMLHSITTSFSSYKQCIWTTGGMIIKGDFLDWEMLATL